MSIFCVSFKFAPLTDLRPVRSPDMFRYASACHPVVWTCLYDYHKLTETENPFTAPLETRQTTLQCNMYVFTMRKRARVFVDARGGALALCENYIMDTENISSEHEFH